MVDGPPCRVGRHVGAEQHAVRPALDERTGGVGLASQLRDPRRQVHVEVRRPLEDRRDPGQVLGGATHVGADEGRPGVADHDGLEPVDELVERREPVQVGAARRARRPEVPVRVRVELLPALVAPVERLEEGDRVRDVDRDRHIELARGSPERVKACVVHGHQPTARVPGAQAQQLPDLEAACAGGHALAQPGRLRLAEARVARPALVVQAGEHGHPSGQRLLPALDLPPEAVTPAAVEIHQSLHARAVHHGGQLGRAPTRPVAAERHPEVVVGIDDREPRLGDRVGRDAQRLAGPVVLERQPLPHRHQPLSPVSAMPRTKYFCAITNRVIIGTRLTMAPAIISGHLPTNWPWKKASPTVVVYWSRSRR